MRVFYNPHGARGPREAGRPMRAWSSRGEPPDASVVIDEKLAFAGAAANFVS